MLEITNRRSFKLRNLVFIFHLIGVLGWISPIPRTLFGPKSLTVRLDERRVSLDYEYYDDYYSDDVEEGDDEDDEDDYWNDEGPPRDDSQRGGMYKVTFGDVDPKETQLDWEVCTDGENEALVLLPPASVERPTAILHFVGGTFFGSSPKLWYRQFLEGLVRNTQCAVVVTPIPVTLFSSPLQHIPLAKKMRSAFDNAWEAILEDEYGDLSDVPLCGMGHSLGSRLLVVLGTLNKNKPRGPIPPYKSFVLVSFTNYGASAGIPGISTLLRQSRKHKQVAQVAGERQRRKSAQKARQDWWVDDDYMDVDEEWNDLVDDLQGLIQEQTTRVKKVLTPKSEDLEFSPSPDKLWKALKEDQRYNVSQTLLVQFDDDPVDQSSKLAQILKETNASDIKFARLRGTHLSPVSVTEGGSGGWLTSQASKSIWKAIRGRGKTKAQEAAMRDLRQSIARYITDVVTK